MDESPDQALYRQLIDTLAERCYRDTGTVSAQRARAGLWNANFTEPDPDAEVAWSSYGIVDQYEINRLLATMADRDCEILARMLQEAFEGGIQATLTVLFEADIAPLDFDHAYEGDPAHDLVGRLTGWEWPS
jgi:hypothetical protein